MKLDEKTRERVLAAEVRALRARLRDLRKRIRALPETGREHRRLVALELAAHDRLMQLLEPPGVLTESWRDFEVLEDNHDD
ncbi:MAG: hypothetical protein WHT08_18605 [Bryobacteraceae bacterium]|jgi:septal ring factor EnvC (AmiA/AmiB activator)